MAEELKLRGCPFCGTNPEDKDYPPSTIYGGGMSFECGRCGAHWPKFQRDDVADSSDEDIVALLNRRPAEDALSATIALLERRVETLEAAGAAVMVAWGPEQHMTVAQVERWLADYMAPAIAELRATLKGAQ